MRAGIYAGAAISGVFLILSYEIAASLLTQLLAMTIRVSTRAKCPDY
ncbi:hypothetical protein [Rickettsia felis]|nr:hypothetical protein [Rickettsia felis]